MAQVLQIEHEILAPAYGLIHGKPMLRDDLPLKQLIPENTVIKICRVLHHKAGKFLQTQKPVLFNVPLMGHPVPDDPVKIRDHHVRPAVPGCPYHKAGGVRCDPVVAVQKLDECSPGL